MGEQPAGIGRGLGDNIALVVNVIYVARATQLQSRDFIVYSRSDWS